MSIITKFIFSAGAAVIAAFVFMHTAELAVTAPSADASGVLRQMVLTREPRIVTSSYFPSGSDPGGNSPINTPTSNVTSNWAGYVSTGGTYTAVSGSWTIPSVAADNSAATEADATWIGIGGQTSDDLIQVGTQNIIEDGQVSTSTFYEGLPDSSETLPGVNVAAGDKIAASIKEASSGEWEVSISDLANGESYSNTVAYDSSESSAEWIEEAPSTASGVMPLDSFGAVSFTDGSATENGSAESIAGSDAQALTMANAAGQALTDASAINGGSFTVSRTSASSESFGGSTGVPGPGSDFGNGFPGGGQWWPGQDSGRGFGGHRWRDRVSTFGL